MVDEIIEIMNDKVIMKNIDIKTKYIGFDEPINKFMIKTDMKRL